MRSKAEGRSSHRASYNYILLVSIDSEEEQLLAACTARHIDVEEATCDAGKYYHLGDLGRGRVAAIRVKKMGSIGIGASAWTAHRYVSEFQATGVVCLGMAFGYRQHGVRLNDILVSRVLVPYDLREIHERSTSTARLRRSVARRIESVRQAVEGSPARPEHALRTLTQALVRLELRLNAATFRTTYDIQAAEGRRTSPELQRRCEEAALLPQWRGRVHFGAVLSGGARVSSLGFIQEAAATCRSRSERVVGGEMEGAGLLALQRKSYIVVKSVSDFGEATSRSEVGDNRDTACRLAADFVLDALSMRQEVE